MGRISEVIIASGIPGSGKTTWIRNHTNPWMTEIFSADNYFLDESGVYRFDAERIACAHAWCLRSFTERFMELLNDRTDCCPVTLVVDNTNTTAWEIAPYYSLPSAYGVPVRIVRMIADPARAHARNAHGVERTRVEEMHMKITRGKLPSFWNVEEVSDW